MKSTYGATRNTFRIDNISFNSVNGKYDSDFIGNKLPIKQDQNISLKLHKRGSTDYFLTVNASKPYTLAFTEFYDPFWVARVKTTGESTES